MDRAGTRLSVLDAGARTVATLGPGTGLVAATRFEGETGAQGATWVVTGTDERGVLAAADALEEGALGNHFALAISPGGVAVSLPRAGPGAVG